MDLTTLQKEIARMERQVDRQRREIRQLDQAGIDATSANDLLARMQDRVRAMRLQRDEAKRNAKPTYQGSSKIIQGTPARRRA